MSIKNLKATQNYSEKLKNYIWILLLVGGHTNQSHSLRGGE